MTASEAISEDQRDFFERFLYATRERNLTDIEVTQLMELVIKHANDVVELLGGNFEDWTYDQVKSAYEELDIPGLNQLAQSLVDDRQS